MNYASFPTKTYFEEILKNEKTIQYIYQDDKLTFEKVKESVVALRINFESMTETHIIEQISTPIINLISNIGLI